MPDVRTLCGPAAALLLLGCVACTAPAPPSPVAPSTTAAAPGTITLPPRPRDVPIDDVDPCSLLTQQTLTELGLSGTPRNRISSTELLGEAPTCSLLSIDGDPNLSLNVVLAPDTGIERYTAGELLTDVSPTTIEGFPAILARPQPFPDVCNVVVDIAPAQLINIGFADGGANEIEVPQDQLCESAQQAADAVMQALLADS